MTAAPAAVAGVLLTGGRSSRMGRDKASLPHPGGDSFALRAGRLLASTCCPAIEVGPGRSGLLAVADSEPGAGPLVAVAAAWSRLRSLGCAMPALVLGCDLPLVSGELLARLARWPGTGSVVPVLGGTPQWCCARYDPACLQSAVSLVAGGRRDLRALGEAAEQERGVLWLGEEQLGEDLALLADADTPEDLASLGLPAPGLPAPGLPAPGSLPA